MRCEEASGYGHQELLGQPVDQDKLEEAFAHISACQELCAQVLGAAPDFDLLSDPEARAGQTDLYESLGLSAEEEGDAHARLVRLAKVGKVGQETALHERAMALAAWQSAAAYYHDGLRLSKTEPLAEGFERIKRKRLETGSNPTLTKPGTAGLDARRATDHGPQHKEAPG